MNDKLSIDPNYSVAWVRVPMDKEKLCVLNERKDSKGFLQAGGHVLLMVTTAGLALWGQKHLHWGWVLLLVYLHGVVCSFMINAVHELVHGTVFKTKWLNEVFAGFFAFVGWINHIAFWASHSEHHKYTLHNPHDLEVVVPIPLEFKWFVRTMGLHVWQISWIGKPLLSLCRGIPVGGWGEHLYGDREVRFKIFNWARFMVAGHLLILIISVINGWWLLPVLTSFTPLYGNTLQFLLNNTQHVGLQDHVNDFRLNSRTFNTNPVFRYLYWHMNYHIEHHMFAGVPCYNLKKLHEEIQSELPYTFKGLPETWFHIIMCLYRQKYEPGYVYVPVIPGGDKPEEVGAENRKSRKVPPHASESKASAASLIVDDGGIPFKTWECSVCGFIYDERMGLMEEGIAPGTRWDEIPDDWRCPDCGVAKADFAMKEISRPRDLSALPRTVEIGKESGAPYVIIGSGMAAYQLVKEFRKLNEKKPLLLLTENKGEFYSKPALSNALARHKSPDDLVLSTLEEMEKSYGISIRANCSVSSVDPVNKFVLCGEERIAYSRLVFATGSCPNQLPFDGPLTVNHLDDYARFRERLPAGGRVTILGAGLIGCEFANDLIDHGYQVQVVDQAALPLASLVDEKTGRALKDALADRGVQWQLGQKIESAGGTEVQLADGTSLLSDVVLSALGVRPRIDLALASGIATNRGIQVNHLMQSSIEDVYAIGDCAEIDGRIRPYVEPILVAARALALTLSGTDTPVDFPEMPVVVKTPAYPIQWIPGS